jgi:cobalamin biosynthesis protein CobT
LKRAREWSLNKLTVEKEVDDIQNPGQKIKTRSWDLLSDFGKLSIATSVFGSTNFDKQHWFLTKIVEKDILDKIFQCEDLIREAVSASSTEEVVECARKLMKKVNEEEEPLNEIAPEDIPDNAVIAPPLSPLEETMWKKQPADPNAPPIVRVEPDDEEDEKSLPSSGQPVNSDPINTDPINSDPSSSGTSSGTRPLDQFDPDAKGQGGDCNFEVTDEDLERDQKIAAMPEMLKEATHKEFTGKDSYLIYTTNGDVVEKIKDGDRIAYKAFMTEANRMVSVMKRKMSRSLLATNVSRWEGDKTRGKINPHAIFRVSLGTSKRVFRQKVEAEDFDTAIQIMIDHSGSMSGYKLDVAAKTSIIFGEIANQLNIPFSVTGFSTGDSNISYGRYHNASKEEQQVYKRWGNHWIGMYKDFDESWAQSSHRMVNMLRNQRINTYDGESIKYGAQRLLVRPEKRKILFWLNDGQPCPNDCDDDAAHEEYAKLCSKEIEKYIELLAIGIYTDAVKRYYTNYVVVNDLKDLPSICLGQLDDLLRKGKNISVGNMKKVG